MSICNQCQSCHSISSQFSQTWCVNNSFCSKTKITNLYTDPEKVSRIEFDMKKWLSNFKLFFFYTFQMSQKIEWSIENLLVRVSGVLRRDLICVEVRTNKRRKHWTWQWSAKSLDFLAPRWIKSRTSRKYKLSSRHKIKLWISSRST